MSGCTEAGRSAAVAAGSARPGPSPSPNSVGTRAQAVPAEPRQLRAAVPASAPSFPRHGDRAAPRRAGESAAATGRAGTGGARAPASPSLPRGPAVGEGRAGRSRGRRSTWCRPAPGAALSHGGGRAPPLRYFPPRPPPGPGSRSARSAVRGQVSPWLGVSSAPPRPLVRFLFAGLPPSRGPQ